MTEQTLRATTSSEAQPDESEALVATCMEYVPVAAYLGDAQMVDIMAEAATDGDALELSCKALVVDDPERAGAMAEELAVIRAAATASTVPATAAPTTTSVAVTQPPPPPPVASQALMPDVVCMDLQTAQDTIQRAGVFFSRSVDATGNGRMQLVDSNWLVVAQDPAPGTPFGEGDALLAVVKFGEGSC